MAYYDEQLRQLREQISREGHLRQMLREYRRQQSELYSRVCELEQIKLTEQADVDRLEGHSLASFFYHVVGRMDEKLDEERQEAYAAKVKYDVARREWQAVEQELSKCIKELDAIKDCRARYGALLEEKRAAVKSAGGQRGERILQLEEELAVLHSHRKELTEARAAGSSALSTAKRMGASLEKAEQWGKADLLTSKTVAFVSYVEKNRYLDETQEEMTNLQRQLRKFRTELSDVTIGTDVSVQADGFLRFADYFFDGLIVDWTVLNRIRNSKEEISKVERQLRTAVSSLDSKLDAVEKKQKRLAAELASLVSEAEL